MVGRGIRLSLRTKVSVLAAVVLILMVGIANGMYWRAAGQNFAGELTSSHARMALRLNSMLEQQRQSGLLALRSLGGLLLAGDERRTLGDEALDRIAVDSGLDLEFESLLLAGPKGDVLGRSGASQFEELRSSEPSEIEAALMALARRVASERQPTSLVHCETECLLLVGEPLLDASGDVLAIAGSRSIAEWVTSFADLDDAELIVWKLGASGETPTPLANSAGEALAARIAPWIRAEAQAESMQNPLVIESEGAGRYYALSQIPLETQVGNRAPVVLALVQDITQAQKQLWLQRLSGLAVSLVVLGIGVWMIGSLLRPALQRIRRLAEAMPMIAEGRFDEAGQLVGGTQGTWTDEVDILEETARALVLRLQQLGSQVEDRDRALRSRIEELDRQGAFVDRLLEHAQLAILVHDARSNVIRLNGRGREVLAQVSTGADLSFLFASEALARQSLETRLREMLVRPHSSPVESEAVIPGERGARQVQWLHCVVSGPKDEPLILSIGLDLTRERDAMAELRWVADHDGLTGLYNRRSIHREIDRLVDAGEEFAMFFIDLDGFGLVNKSDGHEAGNEVLQIVAGMLERSFSEGEFVARSGGDEFMALLRDARPELVQERAAALIRALSTQVTTKSGKSHEISCCVGISIYPLQGRTASELLAHADAALLEAKRSGQGEWVWQADANRLIERSQYATRWKERLQEALAFDRFFLDFQPIVELSTGEISHYECLIRLRYPDGSLANPGEFIGVAEEYGLIHRIDYWVIESAVDTLRELGKVRPDLGLAVNVSGPTLQRSDFVETVRRVIERSGLVRPRLMLELTETAALRDIAAAQSAMSELCQLGCEFALDDFGVGYSSFAYLRELPFSYVKLDGSYVRQALKDERNQSFIRAMVLLANGYQLKTVAEFVESAELQDFLRDAGVHYGQGYHIAKPGPLPYLT